MEGKRNIAKVMHPISCIEKVDEISKSVKLHDISAANYAKLSHAIWHYLPPILRIYSVSRKTVPTWLFALLSVSTRANCKSWDIFEKFRKFAT